MSTILVVEDDKFLGSAYRAKLTKSGFTVLFATDGQEALDILKTEKPDIILMDLVMPRLDGFATLEIIKKDPKLKSIPVIVASNLGQKEDRDRAAALDAADYIIKSDLTMDGLVAKVNTVLQAK